MKSFARSQARLEHHFAVERELALRIMHASTSARKSLYTSVYDELFVRVEDHPQLLAIADPAKRRRRIGWQVRQLRKLLDSNGDFLEIGPGDCALSIAMCEHVNSVTAVDVSNESTRREQLPDNFALRISDGTSIDCASNSIDLAYSDQLMEHLHPDDARDQLVEIYRVLRRGGKYLVITPSSALGPHDVTKFFDEDVPLGLHLKEYSYAELDRLLANVGFSSRQALIGAMGRYAAMPMSWADKLERAFLRCPRRLRRKMIKSSLFRPILNILFGIRIVATKN